MPDIAGDMAPVPGALLVLHSTVCLGSSESVFTATTTTSSSTSLRLSQALPRFEIGRRITPWD